MSYACKILADSISPHGDRLTTFLVTFPRIVLAEFNTHRMLSRNSASSRAIPVEKRIAAVEEDPFVPAAFGRNRPGMQAVETLTGEDHGASEHAWLLAKDEAVKYARVLAGLGVHKQLANRLIEPWCWHTCVVSATEWANFFALRCHKDAQPEIRTIAEMMREQHEAEDQIPRVLQAGEWHLPFIDWDDEISEPPEPGDASIEIANLVKVSAGRCARVSYLTHDGKRDLQADVDLAARLVASGHMSPLEHPAKAMTAAQLSRDPYCGNYRGWIQFRKLLPGEAVFVP